MLDPRPGPRGHRAEPRPLPLPDHRHHALHGPPQRAAPPQLLLRGPPPEQRARPAARRARRHPQGAPAAQSRLVESDKMATLGNLAAGMAHELNNPVGAMLTRRRAPRRRPRAPCSSTPRARSPPPPRSPSAGNRPALDPRRTPPETRTRQSDSTPARPRACSRAGVRSADDSSR